MLWFRRGRCRPFRAISRDPGHLVARRLPRSWHGPLGRRLRSIAHTFRLAGCRRALCHSSFGPLAGV
eukprot:5334299-Alexandrium_andersonii.AAC.1